MHVNILDRQEKVKQIMALKAIMTQNVEAAPNKGAVRVHHNNGEKNVD